MQDDSGRRTFVKATTTGRSSLRIALIDSIV